MDLIFPLTLVILSSAGAYRLAKRRLALRPIARWAEWRLDMRWRISFGVLLCSNREEPSERGFSAEWASAWASTALGSSAFRRSPRGFVRKIW
jgi:inner membrane protein involved in colicin E2 resistance